jgi:hypothetical protein
MVMKVVGQGGCGKIVNQKRKEAKENRGEAKIH